MVKEKQLKINSDGSINVTMAGGESQTRALKRLLEKLGIKSAAVASNPLQDAFDRIQNNFGQPDRLIMSPQALNAFKKAFYPKS